MSQYPANLSSRIKYLSSFSTNNVKINPSSSLTGLQNITTSGDITIDLPPNSLVDLSSLTLWADFSTGNAINEAEGIRTYFLTRNANSLIQRIQVEIGGQLVSDINDYNRINAIMSDLQLSYESGSKRILNNYDPLMKRNLDGTFGAVAKTSLNLSANVINDSRKIAMNNFLGFLGTSASDCKYIDTGILGNVRITFTMAPASTVLIKSAHSATAGVTDVTTGALTAGHANVNDALFLAEGGPTYSLANVYATIKKVHIDDGVFYQTVATALQSGIPFQYMFNSFNSTKSNQTTGELTIRHEITSGSVDMALMTFYDMNGHICTTLPGIDNIGQDATAFPKKGATELALGGKRSSFSSNYFRRKGDEISKTQFHINGEPAPLYAMDNEQVFDKLLQDFNKHDSIDDGIYPGINSIEAFNEYYWVASLRLSHVSGETGWVSGLDCRGIPATIECKTTATAGANNDKIGMLTIISTNVLQCFAGRQLNLIK